MQKHDDGTIVFEGPEETSAYRLLALRSAFSLELKGIRIRRGVSVYALVKREFGFKGNKQRVYDQFNEYVGKVTGVEKKGA